MAGRLSLHSLRHVYAFLLIGSTVNPQFVGRQLGHANPSVTLEVYGFAALQQGLADSKTRTSVMMVVREGPPSLVADAPKSLAVTTSS